MNRNTVEARKRKVVIDLRHGEVDGHVLARKKIENLGD